MSAQQNYNSALNRVQSYYNLNLMNSEDIEVFNEAKRIGSAPWSLGTGFPTKAATMMRNLLADIEARQQQATTNSKHNNGSTFRASASQ